MRHRLLAALAANTLTLAACTPDPPTRVVYALEDPNDASAPCDPDDASTDDADAEPDADAGVDAPDGDASQDADAALEADADAALEAEADAPPDAPPEAEAGPPEPSCTPAPFSVGAKILDGKATTATGTASVATTAMLPAGHTVRCIIGADNLLSTSGPSDVFRSATLGGQGMRKKFEWNGASTSPGGSSLVSWWTMTAAEDMPAGSALETKTYFGVLSSQAFVCQDLGVIPEGCALEVDGSFAQKTAAGTGQPPVYLTQMSVTGALPGEHLCDAVHVSELAYDPTKPFNGTSGWTALPGAGTNIPGQPTNTNIQLRGEYRIVPDAASTTSAPWVTQNARRVDAIVCMVQRAPGEEVEEEALCGLGDVPTFTTSPVVSGVAPTIVQILGDDMDRADYESAPRMLTLAAAGMSFDEHIVPVPLCCPSRADMFLGQYSHNSGVFTNGGTDGGFATYHGSGKEAVSVATWLTATYRTVLIGKYLNGYPNNMVGELFVPPGWDDWVVPCDGAPYTESNYSLNVNGTKITYGDSVEDYLNDVLTDYAVSIINSTPPTQPLFLLLNPYLTHAPGYPPLRDRDCPADGLDHGGSFDEADVSDKPLWIKNSPHLTSQQITEMNTLRKRRQRSMISLERMVMKVMEALEKNGRLHYLSVTSDNGFHQGQHRMVGGKGTAYEEDIRVPMWVRGPGITPGSSTTLLTANVDLAPTWAAIAGVTPPSWVDGRSLLGILHGSTPSPWRNYVLLEHRTAQSSGSGETNEPPDGDDAPAFDGLRMPGHTFVALAQADEKELYDNFGDPFQLVNRWNDTPSATRGALFDLTGQLKIAGGASLRALEETDLPSGLPTTP